MLLLPWWWPIWSSQTVSSRQRQCNNAWYNLESMMIATLRSPAHLRGFSRLRQRRAVLALSACLSICLSACLSTCLSTWLSSCLSTWPPVFCCVSISPMPVVLLQKIALFYKFIAGNNVHIEHFSSSDVTFTAQGVMGARATSACSTIIDSWREVVDGWTSELRLPQPPNALLDSKENGKWSQQGSCLSRSRFGTGSFLALQVQ